MNNDDTAQCPKCDRRQVLSAAISLALLPSIIPPAHSSTSTSTSTSTSPHPTLRPLSPQERSDIDAAFAATMPKAKAPVMLRLVFHDAGTYNASQGNGGINASIQYELERPENFGLKRGWNVITATHAKLASTRTTMDDISYADLIALAGARAVRITGGPDIDVGVGRKDAIGADPPGRLPGENFSAQEQLEAFGAMGISPQQFIALCGSHTLGSKGYGDPLTFDPVYYQMLLKKPWEDTKDPMASMIGIPTDHVLPDDATCRPWIEKYAGDGELFFNDFSAAYIKLSSLGV